MRKYYDVTGPFSIEKAGDAPGIRVDVHVNETDRKTVVMVETAGIREANMKGEIAKEHPTRDNKDIETTLKDPAWIVVDDDDAEEEML